MLGVFRMYWDSRIWECLACFGECLQQDLQPQRGTGPIQSCSASALSAAQSTTGARGNSAGQSAGQTCRSEESRLQIQSSGQYLKHLYMH